MKVLLIFSFLALVSCQQASSPEGRSIIRDEQIWKQIDSLKSDNRILHDHIAQMAKRLDKLEKD